MQGILTIFLFHIIIIIPYVFWRLTSPPIFHRFLQIWYQNVQLVQEIMAMTFGVCNFYTF